MSSTDVAEARREISAEDLNRSLRQLLDEPMHEIENLIGACERLRETLQTGADCIERSIVDYAKLSRSVIGVTGIIHEAVEKFLSTPDGPAATSSGREP